MSGAHARIIGVGKTYTSRTKTVEALAPVTLDLKPDEFTTLIGTSGCGKSTLLHIVAGLESSTVGLVEVDGQEVHGPGRDRGMVFQSYTLFPWLTVQRNVEFALKDIGLSRREQRERAREYLDLVGVSEFANAMPSQLSGGMRQRVAIARALSYQPRMLLMDEPFGALDAQTRQEMQELLLRVWDAHKLNVLFVTHDIDEAIFLSDRIIMLAGRPGRVKLDLRPEIPRPRSMDLLTSTELMHHKSQLLSALREEGREATALK
ncbi:ABC transporter ATP-binding protein [Rhodococcus sp. (in: high G+C Gram-positive bacteria)]|uniref:ABC transporter ATP-binding protein n=1 Tax=Rhodococcus sp. TaxID=1831 RepID=UPI002579D0FA|nr:ABC transporter ATP-binding protein [Rhodococcus sp. (in: high G+C Gram-positive bacteria)]MBQ7803122.1 ABC transporter ATP-binding protein [Rhodococcus sp. (in: high G+C Gram-positive bacteria)]